MPQQTGFDHGTRPQTPHTVCAELGLVCLASGADHRSAKQLCHLLLHSFAEGRIHCRACKSTGSLQSHISAAGNQLHLGFAVTGNDDLLADQSRLHQARELVLGIQHVHLHG